MRGDGKRENWLLIKEDDEEAAPGGSNGAFLEERASSITTRRSMDEIAGGAGPVKRPTSIVSTSGTRASAMSICLSKMKKACSK